MPKSVFVPVLAVALTGLLLTGLGSAGEKKPDEQAKEVVRQFFKALHAREMPPLN